MPSTDQILSELNRITNEGIFLAILWHVYYGVIAMLLITRVYRSIRLLGVLLAIPLFSVAAIAWINGNPFNGSLFTLAGVVLITITVRFPRQPIVFGPWWMLFSGTVLFLFGWMYPHFLNTSSAWMYLYATPVGLIPCPTLSASIGGSLIVNALCSRAWILTLGIIGLFYGLFGALILEVPIDSVLVLGAVAAIIASFGLKKTGSDSQR